MAHKIFTLMNLFREFFSLKKTLESPIANRIGIQVLRKVAFKCAYNYTSNRTSRRDSTIKRFKKDGYFVMHNFLSKDDFDSVKREYYKSLDNLQPGSKNPDLYGCYQIFQVLKDHNINVLHDIEPNLDQYPATFQKLLYNSKLQNFVSAALGSTQRAIFDQVIFKAKFEQTIQLEHDEESERGPHSNAQFHVDTFHPILKAYFLINDTDTTNGAFRYIKSSNTLSTKQLTRTYIDSNYDYANPSYQKRYSDEEVEQFGHIEHFSYPRNTLIFADTSGLHARGYFSTNKTRELVYIDCRYNPFLEIRNIIKQFLP